MRLSTLIMLGGVSLGLYWVGYAADLLEFRTAVKAIPALALAAWVWHRSKPMATPIAIGLVFGSIGDVVLELGIFIPGLVAFLLGHLAYIVAFTKADNRLELPLLAPFILFVGALIGLLWGGLGPLKIPVVAYATVIGAMMWRAAVRARNEDLYALLGLAGAIIFAVSDALIAVNKFFIPVEGVRVPILLTYWVAQTLIAASVPPRPAAQASARQTT